MPKKTLEQRAQLCALKYGNRMWLSGRSYAEKEKADCDYKFGFLSGYRAAKRDEKIAAKGRGKK